MSLFSVMDKRVPIPVKCILPCFIALLGDRTNVQRVQPYSYIIINYVINT